MSWIVQNGMVNSYPLNAGRWTLDPEGKQPEQLPLFDEPEPSKPELPDWWKGAATPKRTPRSRSPKRTFGSREEYYQSEEWKVVRAFALNRAHHRCQRCGRSGPLDVHHRTYENLYNEKPGDLEVLCRRCHFWADREREGENHYNSAFETYMCKKYGEDWEWFNGCEEEFDAWFERKQDSEW